MQTLIATNVAKHLAPFVASASSPSVDAADDTRPPSADTEPPIHVSTPNTSANERDVDLSLSYTEVKTKSFTYSKELLTSSKITPIYTKSKNGRNFTPLLVQKLFDVPTHMRSNVAGRGKEKKKTRPGNNEAHQSKMF